MAKINARGAREVARWEAFREGVDEDGAAYSYRFLFLLRSDGKVLRRLADKDLGGTYSIFASFKPTDNKSADGARTLLPGELVTARKARVERMLTNKGYRWAAQAVRV
jgi:hypothetical protein